MKKLYHVFGNGWDEFCDTYRQAKIIYVYAKKEGQRDLRIIEELVLNYDTENEDFIEGDTLDSCGQFPY